MIKTEIIQDSINSCGNRLTTFVLEYPRWIHAELLTHRVFSKNSASSRAIPFEKFVQQIQDNPATPEFWGKNQKGMQAVEELDDSKKSDRFFEFADYDKFFGNLTDKECAKHLWLSARDGVIKYAKKLNEIGVHKQIVNRILEPWFHIRVILSGTEFQNFFALRAHEDTQPEFQKLAYLMLDEYNKSTPKQLKTGEWHIPFSDRIDEDKLIELYNKTKDLFTDEYKYDHREELRKKISIARCARVSYYNFDGKDDYEADIRLCNKLFSSVPLHLSPSEHCAMALGKPEFIGNFCGWKQYRKFFQNENLRDERVIDKVVNKCKNESVW